MCVIKHNTKSQPYGRKIKLSIHLMYCKACRQYTKNNRKLTKKMKESKVECLDSNYKENMKKELDKAIKEQAS